MEQPPLVYAAVLAWNQRQETLESLASLSRSTYSNLRFLLVDNGSTDGTSEAVRREFPGLEIVRSETNLGVGPGYNLGIDYALRQNADYVLVMNNDTVVDPEMVSELVHAIETHPRIGMVAPKIYHYYGNRNRLWCAGARWAKFPPRIKLVGADQSDGPQYQHLFPLEYAIGCCLLMSRPALEETGGFDPEYFFYYEDWDLSARFRKAGYEIWFAPEAHLWHKVSVSWQNSGKPARWWFYNGQSSVRFYRKHKTLFQLGLYTAWFALRETVKLNYGIVPAYLRGVASGLNLLKRKDYAKKDPSLRSG